VARGERCLALSVVPAVSSRLCQVASCCRRGAGYVYSCWGFGKVSCRRVMQRSIGVKRGGGRDTRSSGGWTRSRLRVPGGASVDGRVICAVVDGSLYACIEVIATPVSIASRRSLGHH
jgi:hypothetical protein